MYLSVGNRVWEYQTTIMGPCGQYQIKHAGCWLLLAKERRDIVHEKGHHYIARRRSQACHSRVGTAACPRHSGTCGRANWVSYIGFDKQPTNTKSVRDWNEKGYLEAIEYTGTDATTSLIVVSLMPPDRQVRNASNQYHSSGWANLPDSNPSTLEIL
jgi:hypothetical protein